MLDYFIFMMIRMKDNNANSAYPAKAIAFVMMGSSPEEILQILRGIFQTKRKASPIFLKPEFKYITCWQIHGKCELYIILLLLPV